MTDMEKWAVFFRYANVPEHRMTVNRVIETKEALQMAGNLLMSVSQSEREQAIFRSRRMYQTDLESNIATAKELGKREGVAIGKAEGVAVGIAKGKVEIARNMKASKMPFEEIATLTGFTIAQINEL
jgi:predicted transposase/invertase (TIGR01784 family)